MEVSTQSCNLFSKIDEGATFQEIVPYSSDKLSVEQREQGLQVDFDRYRLYIRVMRVPANLQENNKEYIMWKMLVAVGGPSKAYAAITKTGPPTTTNIFHMIYSEREVDKNVSQGPTISARAGVLESREPLDKDALLAVKLDPAVLEAQVTLTKGDQPDRSALVAKSKAKDVKTYPSFEEAMSMQQAALLQLTPQQLELLMAFVDTLRLQRQHAQRHMECAFCKNNGTPASWYASHSLRDRRRVRCPVLRALRCPRCGATGDRAHTLKYCPDNLFSDSWSCP